MLAQWLVALNERAIGQRYSLHVAIILLVDEPIYLGNRPIGLATLAPTQSEWTDAPDSASVFRSGHKA